MLFFLLNLYHFPSKNEKEKKLLDVNCNVQRRIDERIGFFKLDFCAKCVCVCARTQNTENGCVMLFLSFRMTVPRINLEQGMYVTYITYVDDHAHIHVCVIFKYSVFGIRYNIRIH